MVEGARHVDWTKNGAETNLTSANTIASPVYKARGLGGTIVYDGANVTLSRDTLTSMLMSLVGISNDYGTQIISAKVITSIEIVRQMGFVKKLLPIYFIRFVYPGSSIINSRSINSAFAHNTILMSVFDNRDFFRLREALLADARGGQPSQTTIHSPLNSSGSAFYPRTMLKSALMSIVQLGRKLLINAERHPRAVIASAIFLIASISAVSLYVMRPRYTYLARLGVEVSYVPWSQAVEVSWIGKDDAKYRSSISVSALDALEGESQNMILQAPSRAAQAFQAEFAPRLEKITTDARRGIVNYANWTFDWGTSYWLLIDALKAAAGTGEEDDKKSAIARADSLLRQKITAQYKDSLFPEERFALQLRSGLEKSFSLAISEISTSCQSFSDLFESSVNSPVQRLYQGYWIIDPTWSDAGLSIPACAAAMKGLQETEARLQLETRQAMTETYVPEIAIARLARPLMTITIGVIGSATGLTLAAVRFGLPRALLVSPLVTAAGVKLAITVTDLALTSLDETVNRAQFEADISSELTKAQAKVLDESLEHVSETITAALNMRLQ